MASRFRYFIAVSPGLESLLLEETRRLGLVGSVTPGGVECAGPIEALWTLHHRSRLAESVRLRLRPFRATSFEELEHGLRRLPWHAYLKPGSAFGISVTCQGSRLYHTDAIAERIRHCIEVGWTLAVPSTPTITSSKQPPSATPTDQKLFVRVKGDFVQISIGASGERLHRRGYRTHVGEAPLRETLAAATIELLLTLAPGRSVTMLWDPCCGSGTLLAEWLLRQSGRALVTMRHFAFEQWPVHDPVAYAAWLDESRECSPSNVPCHAYGSDHDARVIAAAQHNLERAGVSDLCDLFPQDFREAEPRIPKNSAVVANLPYGVRLQDRKSAARILLALDQLLQKRSDLRPALVLTTSAPPNEKAQRWQRLAEFANGGLRVTAWALKAPMPRSPHCATVEPPADCAQEPA